MLKPMKLLILISVFAISACQSVRNALIDAFTPTYEAEPTTTSNPVEASKGSAEFSGADAARKRIAVALEPLPPSFTSPTAIDWLPRSPEQMLVLEQGGNVVLVDMTSYKRHVALTVPVLFEGEQGLLGIALHPKFSSNRRFYLNYVAMIADKRMSRVSEWQFSSDFQSASGERLIFDLEQPYANHNAGQLAFGPDGYLYIGWGDGGWRDDPHGNGQKPGAALGKMLRIDVDTKSAGLAYGIPKDNPFVGRDGQLPEVFATGFRNPWRYSFAPDGRLIVADVGQDSWEEISIVERGGNYGWNIREGFQCFQEHAACKTERDLRDPIYAYDREDGGSVTGGYVYTGRAIADLAGKYVFGDFLSGRIWALDLPSDSRTRASEAYALGKYPILPSTFGRNSAGELFVADYGTGKIFALRPAAN